MFQNKTLLQAVQVTGRNAEEYCNLVVAALLERGVRAQVDAFLSGVDSVLDARQLQCLYEVRYTSLHMHAAHACLKPTCNFPRPCSYCFT